MTVKLMVDAKHTGLSMESARSMTAQQCQRLRGQYVTQTVGSGNGFGLLFDSLEMMARSARVWPNFPIAKSIAE